jgi:hypothetical protein
LIPRCLVEAVVSKKLKDEPTSRTYKVTSCYWGSDAMAVRISRDDFTYVAYTSTVEKTIKHWLRGWDEVVMISDRLVDCEDLCWDTAVFAHLGVLYLSINYLRSSSEDEGTTRTVPNDFLETTFYPWEHQKLDAEKDLYTRRIHRAWAEYYYNSMPKENRPAKSWDAWTTITVHHGQVVKATWQRNLVVIYEDYDTFRIAPARVFTHYGGPDMKDYEMCSIATSVRPLGPDDTPDKILPILTRDVKKVRPPFDPDWFFKMMRWRPRRLL